MKEKIVNIAYHDNMYNFLFIVVRLSCQLMPMKYALVYTYIKVYVVKVTEVCGNSL